MVRVRNLLERLSKLRSYYRASHGMIKRLPGKYKSHNRLGDLGEKMSGRAVWLESTINTKAAKAQCLFYRDVSPA